MFSYSWVLSVLKIKEVFFVDQLNKTGTSCHLEYCKAREPSLMFGLSCRISNNHVRILGMNFPFIP